MLSLKTPLYLHRPVSPLKALLAPLHSSSSLSPRAPSRRCRPLPCLSLFSSAASSATKMPPLSTVEHVVLFKVRDSTDLSKIDAMISNLRSLVTLDIATYLTAGPILRNRSAASESAAFTHLLHSRYRSKADLDTYSAHPAHLAVVKENVFTICDDVMAVDWVAKMDAPADLAAPSPGAAMRLALAKPREGAIAADLVRVIDGVRASLPAAVQVSYGENFSPQRAKGYEVGFISVFPGLDELEALEGKEEIEEHKEKLRPLLESLMVVDYLIPTASSSL